MPIVQVKPGIFPLIPPTGLEAGWGDTGAAHRLLSDPDINWNRGVIDWPGGEETLLGSIGIKTFIEYVLFTIFGNGGLGTHDDPEAGKIVIPVGSTINGVLCRHWISGPFNPGGAGTFDMRAGIMEEDGKWDVTGFSVSRYGTQGSLPFPTLFRSDVVIAGRITENTFATGLLEILRDGTPVSVSFGDGVEIDGTPDFTVGLTAKLQEWIDRPTWDPDDGVIAMVLDPFEVGTSIDFGRFFQTNEVINSDLHPELFIDYTLPLIPAILDGNIVTGPVLAALINTGPLLDAAIVAGPLLQSPVSTDTVLDGNIVTGPVLSGDATPGEDECDG